MKVKILLILLLFIYSSSIAQITYEKGYFIDNNNQKTECLIKVHPWGKNPYKFNYKFGNNETSHQADTSTVSEFGVYGFSKYIRSTVKIDTSETDTANLSTQRNPEFATRKLYLRTIVEGAASLYYFEDDNKGLFFFQVDNSPLEQLIYKQYRNQKNLIAINAEFRQQLRNKVLCRNDSSKGKNNINVLDYYWKDLKEYFIRYNECKGSVSTIYNKKPRRDHINLKVSAGLNQTFLFTGSRINTGNNAYYHSKVNFTIGLDAEYILPFWKGKWRVAINPNYNYFGGSTQLNPYFSYNDYASVNYRYIDFPVGLRYYS